MKKLLLSVLLGALASVAAVRVNPGSGGEVVKVRPGATQVIPTPLEFWKLEEASGSSRTGSVLGVTLTETFGGAVKNTNNGVIGNAIHLNVSVGGEGVQTGSNGAALYYPSLALTTNSFSLCGWFRVDHLPGSPAQIQTIHLKFAGLGGSGPEPLSLLISNTSPLTFNALARGNTAFGSPVVVQDSWFFFRVWWSDADSLCRLQVNNGATYVDANTSSFPTTLAGYLDFDSFPAGVIFDLDEVGLWTPALSDAAATALYNGGAGLTYPFP